MESTHRSSLEGVLDFSSLPPLDADQRSKAKTRLYHILDHFETTEHKSNEYNRPVLARLTYEYALSDESNDIFVRSFFESMQLQIDGDDAIDFDDKDLEKRLHNAVNEFADLLLDNFFLPLVASSKQTPQPSPAPLSAIERAQGGSHEFTGTPNRISVLRTLCLQRDRHCCVISRRFDSKAATTRIERDGANAQDDDGSLLTEKSFDLLEVAHVLPHSMTQLKADLELEASQKAALSILNMFDKGAAYLIDGVDIDEPRNAMSLIPFLHQYFGEFKIYFEPIADQQHTYHIKTFLPPMILSGIVPVIRTLYVSPGRTIDPPSPRLLAIHRAIGHILHLSAAGGYIDKILEDQEERGINPDGTTELGRLVKLRLHD